MHVLQYVRHTWRKTTRRPAKAEEGDWDFGAHQSPDSTTGTPTRSASSATAYYARSASALASRFNLRPSDLDVPPRCSFSRDVYPPKPLPECPPRETPPADPEVEDPISISMSAGSVQPNPENHASSAALLESGRRPDAASRSTVNISGNDGAKADDMTPHGSALSLSDEGVALVAAGASAKESRGISGTGEKLDERRRRAHSIAAARLLDPTSRSPHPALRHMASAYTNREISPPPPSPNANTALPSSTTSTSAFGEAQAGPSTVSPSVRHTLLPTKRSMPQLHNVWETFLEEASEDVGSISVTEINRPSVLSAKRSTVHNGISPSRSLGKQTWRPDVSHPPLPRHFSSPSNSSVLTISTLSSSKFSPSLTSIELNDVMGNPQGHSRSPTSTSSPLRAIQQRQSRGRGHMRNSHQTLSSSSSVSGSTSSLAFSLDLSTTSSMTTVYDDDEPDDTKGVTFHNDPLDRTPPAEPVPTADFSLAPSQHPHNRTSPVPFRPLYPHRLYHTAPNTPTHTPVATPAATTTTFPVTPPLSRSSSRSSSSILKRSGRPSPSLSTTPLPGTNSLAQRRRTPPPPIIPGDLTHDSYGVPRTPGSSKSSVFSPLSRHTSRPSDSSSGCSTEDDVLSELEYYYTSLQKPRTPTPPLPMPPHSASSSPLRRPKQLVNARSKSTSNINLVAKAELERERQLEPVSFAQRFAPSEVQRHPQQLHHNQLHLMVNPPRLSAPADENTPLRSDGGRPGGRRTPPGGNFADLRSSQSHSHLRPSAQSPSSVSQAASPARRPLAFLHAPISPHRQGRRVFSPGSGSDYSSSASSSSRSPSRSPLNPATPLPAVRPLDVVNSKSPGGHLAPRPSPISPGASADAVEWGYAL